MRAQRIDGQTPGGKRTRLADVLPLDTPFSVQIFPVYGCNLACAYCIHSVPAEQRGFVAGKVMLDYALYEKCIDGLAEFPRRLRCCALQARASRCSIRTLRTWLPMRQSAMLPIRSTL